MRESFSIFHELSLLVENEACISDTCDIDVFMITVLVFEILSFWTYCRRLRTVGFYLLPTEKEKEARVRREVSSLGRATPILNLPPVLL